MNPSFDLETPDHFTAGAIGPQGQRVFYLQARQSGSVVTLKAEKEQVAALGEYLAGLLARLPGAGAEASGDAELLEPLAPAWDVGSLAVGYDETRDRILVVASERSEAEDEEDAGEAAPGDVASEEETAAARFLITRAQAATFVERARALIRAGRPICPYCSRPIDPGGHVCARQNGHVARS